MPSQETVLKLAGLAVAALLVFGGGYLAGWMVPALGTPLTLMAAGTAAIAQAMILANVLDSDGQTMLLYYLLPGYDIYFLVVNFWALFPWLCVKYLALALAIGAALGASRHGLIL